MGERQHFVFEPSFNRSVKVEITGDELTSDAGVLLLREADHRLGLTEALANRLYDPRRQDLIRYSLVELLRERIYAMALGYSAQDDADRLAHDPAFKLAVWDQRGDDVIDQRLASQPTQSRLINTLVMNDNTVRLRQFLFDSMNRFLRTAGPDRRLSRATIDLDSFPVEVHGEQIGGAYNGHYQATIYHPLVASLCVNGLYDSSRPGGRFGNGFIGAFLRPGNAYTTDGGLDYLKTLIDAIRSLCRYFDVRLDAGFVTGPYLDYLSEENVRFVGRIKANPRLHRLAEPHLSRQAGRPPKEGYHRVVELGGYQAEDWKHSQRLILVVVDEPGSDGLLFDMPRYFFLLTNYPRCTRSAEEVLAHYRQRGTFEDRLGEFNTVLGPHLSQPDFEKNDVTLLLALLAFNLSSFLRLELEETTSASWDLSRFGDYVLKAGGRVIKHGRRLIVKLAKAVQGFWMKLSSRMARWKFADSLPNPRGPQTHTWMPPPRHAHLELVLRG